MIFEEMEFFGRRKNRRSSRVLRARMKGGTGKPQGGRVAALIFAVVALGIVVAALVLGVAYAGRMCFSANDTYVLRDLQIQGESDIVTYFIRERKGIREGTNLFSFDIEKMRDEFLSQRFAAKYRSVEITRVLPDTLKVHATERVPVARIDGSGGLVADKDGYVFGIQAGRQALPVIIGYQGTPPSPGERVHDNARDAVALLDLCERTGLVRGVPILSVDVSGGFRGREDDMRLHLLDQVQADLWWARGEEPTPSSLQDLQGRLEFLRSVLVYAREHGKRVQTVNLTLESYTNNCPVTYWD